MFNQITLIGNLGKTAEIKNSDYGVFAVFSVATSEFWKDKDGQKKNKTSWHNVMVSKAGLVTLAEKFLKKGVKVCVVGKLNYRTYEKDGQNMTVAQIVADNIIILEFDKDNKQEQPQKLGQQELPQYPADEIVDDDIPF